MEIKTIRFGVPPSSRGSRVVVAQSHLGFCGRSSWYSLLDQGGGVFRLHYPM